MFKLGRIVLLLNVQNWYHKPTKGQHFRLAMHTGKCLYINKHFAIMLKDKKQVITT